MTKQEHAIQILFEKLSKAEEYIINVESEFRLLAESHKALENYNTELLRRIVDGTNQPTNIIESTPTQHIEFNENLIQK